MSFVRTLLINNTSVAHCAPSHARLENETVEDGRLAFGSLWNQLHGGGLTGCVVYASDMGQVHAKVLGVD